MRFLVAITTLLAGVPALSAGPAMTVATQQNVILQSKLDTCAIGVRIIFLNLRTRTTPPADIKPDKCAEEGKQAAKEAYAEVVGAFGKAAPPAVVDWRLEWMAAFDAAVPQASDTERDYLRRVGEASGKVGRATNKLEIALE